MTDPSPAITHDVTANAARALLDAATATDGVEALSEQSLLNLAATDSTAPGTSTARHLGITDGDELLAYAQLWDDGAAELVVHPRARRRGHASALLDELRGIRPDVRLWAHGRLPSAQAFAQAHDLVAVRDLYRMARPLGPDDAVDVELPEGFRARAFVPGRDEQGWLGVNGLAFATHPEQGRLTMEDLRARMGQDWFRPQDLLLVEDVTRDQPMLAAFHWTKVEPGSDVGEVYVLGVDPRYQGRGLARPLTRLGLAHLAREGLREVELYVDGENAAARATYARTGFEDAAVDTVYAARTSGAQAPQG